LWSYGSWVYNYTCNQCLSSLTLRVRILLKWGLLNTTLCDKVCHWLAAGRWFSPVFSTNKNWPSRSSWNIVESGVKHHNYNKLPRSPFTKMVEKKNHHNYILHCMIIRGEFLEPQNYRLFPSLVIEVTIESQVINVCKRYRLFLCFYAFSIGCLNFSDNVLFLFFILLVLNQINI
jgi:hypothetical protein